MHHHCIWDDASRGFFTGDTFGLSYRDFDTAAGPWIMPTTTPVQFQPEALRRSIERMLAFDPEWIYVTHYGRVGDVPRLGALLLAQLDEMVAVARATPPGPGRHAALLRGLEAIHLKSLRAHGVTLSDARIRELLALDLELNAQGIAIWLDRHSPHERGPLRFHRPGRRRHRRRERHRRRVRASVRGERRGGRALGHRRRGGAVARRRAGGRRRARPGLRVQRRAQRRGRRGARRRRVAAFGRIDILVNNAGIFRAAEFLDIAEADWDAVIDVNLKGAFLVGQAVAREMVKIGGGAIVNMSSVNGVTAIPSIASYNASKGGIDQLTRVMALALADRGIRVNAVAPGTIATELARKAVLGSAEAAARIMSRTPLRRLGTPDEVAAVCAFLASDAASYMTGEVVYVDGGRLALNYTMPPLPPSP